MTTLEIIDTFLKGNSKVSISEKQRAWLLSQAKKEGVPIGGHSWDVRLYFSDCLYKVNYPPTAEPMGWASEVNTPTNVGSSFRV